MGIKEYTYHDEKNKMKKKVDWGLKNNN